MSAPCVRLAHGGEVGGVRIGGVSIFRGIPYARTPRGALRFAAPEPADAWVGRRESESFAPVPPQWPRSGGADAQSLGGPECLAVNVWTPEPRPSADLPVMVWIPGGGFMRDGASDLLYDGTAFARKGVVFVSLQYRLGVDGFMHFGEEAPANRGLLDQLAALQWVREHIAAFGGNPACVTVFGESAGAGSIACLLGMEQGQGLFQRAIMQSPSVACQTQEEAGVVRSAVANLLGVAPTLQSVGSVPPRDLLYAVHRLATDAALRALHGISQRNFFPLRPVIDGRILSEAPLGALRNRWSAKRDDLQVLVGSNAEEMRLYHVPHGAIDLITADQVVGFMRDTGLPQAAHAIYLRDSAGEGNARPGEVLCAMQSDYYYRVPARRIAAFAVAGGLDTYAYELTWRSPQWGGQLGAAHGVDLPFVFNNLGTPTGLEFTGEEAPQALADAMHGAWVRFAQQGTPGWKAQRQGAQWMQYFNETPWCDIEPASARMDVWQGLV